MNPKETKAVMSKIPTVRKLPLILPLESHCADDDTRQCRTQHELRVAYPAS